MLYKDVSQLPGSIKKVLHAEGEGGLAGMSYSVKAAFRFSTSSKLIEFPRNKHKLIQKNCLPGLLESDLPNLLSEVSEVPWGTHFFF